jgi:hypothetical protein
MRVFIDLSEATESVVEIEYTYHKPEYCDGYRTCPGSIELHSVKVLDIVGYKVCQQVYHKHRSAFGSWQRDIDRVAFDEVQRRIDVWDDLARKLAENYSEN